MRETKIQRELENEGRAKGRRTHSNVSVLELALSVSFRRQNGDPIGDESVGDSESSLHVSLA